MTATPSLSTLTLAAGLVGAAGVLAQASGQDPLAGLDLSFDGASSPRRRVAPAPPLRLDLPDAGPSRRWPAPPRPRSGRDFELRGPTDPRMPPPATRGRPPGGRMPPPGAGMPPSGSGVPPLGGRMPPPGAGVPPPTAPHPGFDVSGELPPLPPGPAAPGEAAGEAPTAPASNEPSSLYTVKSGQGMGHVAQALRKALQESPSVTRIPEIWVPPKGGRIGLPHVIACYNRRPPHDWTVHVDQTLALPPLDVVWPMVEHIKAEGSCPEQHQVPAPDRGPERTFELSPGYEDFETGAGYTVQSGYAYSHYGAAAQRELAAIMPAGTVPPLYPSPGDYGLLHLMACWNTGSSEEMVARADEVLFIPPPVAIADALAFLRENEGACPEDFRSPE